jgi:Flp pilus assembly protein TadD
MLATWDDQYEDSPWRSCDDGQDGRRDLAIRDRRVTDDPREMPDPPAAETDSAAAHLDRGAVNRDLLRWLESLRDFDRAIALQPDLAEAHANRGLVLGRLGRWAAAASAHERAVALRPDEAGFHYNLGVARQALGQYEQAVAGFDRCLSLSPSQARAMAGRGAARAELGQIDAALADLGAAVAARPDDARIRYNRGAVLDKASRLEAALADYRHALSLRPCFPECAYNAALLLLLLGRYEEAWPLYEWRLRHPGYPGHRETFHQPRWAGDDLNGRTLLLHAEQGLGDTIQFCRYASQIKSGRVILRVPQALHRLSRGLPGVDHLVTTEQSVPPFDLHCPLLSLPMLFGTRMDTIPPPALLDVPRSAPVLGPTDGPRIGIAWSGNPTHPSDQSRSMPLRAMLPLLRHANRLYALQTQISEDARAALSATPGIVWLGLDMADTAAAIMDLDLIISVDTSIAHLAATLGRPTWVLLRYRPDWRWLLGRADSPWYPSARLFRQTVSGRWDNVIEDVSEALEAMKSRQGR